MTTGAGRLVRVVEMRVRRPLGLACEHPCDHAFTLITVGWGPDYRRYSVVECTECTCRAWTTEYPPPHTAEHPKFRLGPLMQMSADASGQTPDTPST